MNKLNQIKQALFTATDYADALAKLSAINANVTTYQTYSVIDEFGILFFPTRKESARLPLVVTIDCVSPTVTIEQYLSVYEQGQNIFAQQQPELSKSVPAHDSPVAAEHLTFQSVVKEFELLKQTLDNQYLYLVEQKIKQTESDQPIDVAASLVAFLHGHISATQFLYSQGGSA